LIARRVPCSKASDPLQKWERAIDLERRRLSKAQSILGCLAIALDTPVEQDPTAPHYADVAEVVRDMMNGSIERLDWVNLSKSVDA
jgi:hypothetical protein